MSLLITTENFEKAIIWLLYSCTFYEKHVTNIFLMINFLMHY